MPKSTDTKFATLADDAIVSLRDFFKAKEHTAKDIGVARVATAVLSSWTRQQQTHSAENATRFMVARELATNKEQLAEFVRVSMPDLALAKALPAPQ